MTTIFFKIRWGCGKREDGACLVGCCLRIRIDGGYCSLIDGAGGRLRDADPLKRADDGGSGSSYGRSRSGTSRVVRNLQMNRVLQPG